MAAQDPAQVGSPKGAPEEASREALPRLTEVVPDYEELSPFYQRPSSAPAAGSDSSRTLLSTTRELERQHSELVSTTVTSGAPLPPLRGATIRTYPGAGPRQPYHNPFEAALQSPQSPPVGLNISIERIEKTQIDRPQLPRRQTAGDVSTRSPPTLPERTERAHETRTDTRPPSVYDPIHETAPRRGSRTQLPPIEVGPPESVISETPQTPHYQPLPPLRASHPPRDPYPPLSSSRYTPYSTDRPPFEQTTSRRRYSQNLPRDYRPTSPYIVRSSPPFPPGRQPTVYSEDPYQPSYSSSSYGRARRSSVVTAYPEERRPSRQESVRYPPPLPYPPPYQSSPPYEYSGGRGYYDPYQGFVEFSPDRRLSQQEAGEQVTHMGVPERAYRPSIGPGPASPSTLRTQPPPHGITPATPGKRRGNLPKESKEKLKQWLSSHVSHPYPTEEEKKKTRCGSGDDNGTDQQLVYKCTEKNSPKNSRKVGLSLYLPQPPSSTW